MRGRVAAVMAVLVVVAVAVSAAAVVLLPDGSDGPHLSVPGGPSSSSAPPASTQPSKPGNTLTPCPRRDAERLTVLTLNLHAGRTKAGRLDLERVASELRSWDADLVLLQEVDRGRRRSDGVDQMRWLARRLGFEAAYGATDRSRPGSNGNGILSRWPITDVRLRDLPRAPGYFRRGLVRATVDVRGREIDVFSTHLDHA
ncbi:MAG: endonuclease/exonuclease/phosphatase family protein, partial [Nocardioides sp.]